MCWGLGATAAMMAAGGAGTVLTARRGDPVAIPVALGYFTVMEALQLAGYLVIDQCSSPANQTITLLSMLHIVFQPLVINAFAMELVPSPLRRRTRVMVFTLCALASTVMLLQLYPFGWAGSCQPGAILCGPALCTVSGDWHLAWDVPYNGLMVPVDAVLGRNWGFPTYMMAVFLMPLFYGAWRFVLFHAVAGPWLAGQLTTNPNEIPAIWCLFSIGLLAISLSTRIRAGVAGRAQPA